jgi:hypothetical protein
LSHSASARTVLTNTGEPVIDKPPKISANKQIGEGTRPQRIQMRPRPRILRD